MKKQELLELGNKIKELLPKKLEMLGIEVKQINIEKVTKNNDLELTGIQILQKVVGKVDIAAVIYLENYEIFFEEGISLDMITEVIAKDYVHLMEDEKETMAEIQNKVMDDKFFKPENLYAVVVNYEANEKSLENIPHERILDLAVYPRLATDIKIKGLSSVSIDYELLKKFDYTRSEILDIAKQNTEKVLGDTQLCGLNEKLFGEPDSNEAVYILTNEQNIYGANKILDTKTIDEFAKLKNCDLYILPASIHEVLLVPKQGGDTELKELRAMVKEVNANCVSKKEKLSNNVYKYDKESKELTIAQTTKEQEKSFDMER